MDSGFLVAPRFEFGDGEHLDGSVRKKRNPAALSKRKRDNIFSTDGVGFEPTVRYERTHTFQACALNHSATRPNNL